MLSASQRSARLPAGAALPPMTRLELFSAAPSVEGAGGRGAGTWALPARGPARALGVRGRQRRRDCLDLGRRWRRRARLPLAQLRRGPARPGAHHRASRRLPGARRGPAAGAAPLPGTARRLRPPDLLASLERARGARPRARPRRVLGLGLRQAGPALVLSRVLELAHAPPAELLVDRRRARDVDDARGRRLQPRGNRGQARAHLSLPRHHHRDGRDLAADRRGRHLARRRAPAALLRVVVRRALHGVRRHRARVVPRDPRRQRASSSTGSPPTTGVRSTRSRSPSSSSSGSHGRSCARCASTCASSRSSRKPPGSSRCGSGVAGSSVSVRRPASSSSGASSREASGYPSIPSRSRRRRRATRFASR